MKRKKPNLSLLSVPTGHDNQGRTSPRAATIPSGRVYVRKPKYPDKES